MKLKALVLAAAMVGAANATTIAAGGGTAGATFISSSGVTATAANTSIIAGTLVGNLFTPFSPADVSPLDISTVNNAAFFGKWAGDTSDISAAANAFTGAQIWFAVTMTVEGNVGTAYFSGGQTFPANGNGVGDGITIDSKTLTTLGGPSSALSAAYNAQTNTITVGLIPEPSSVLLGLLGAVGLIRRRR